MGLTSLALAKLHSVHRQAHVSSYVAEQIVLQSNHGSLEGLDWQKTSPGRERIQ